jgi:hypothetical protein
LTWIDFVLLEKHGVSEQRIAAREKLSRLLQNQLQDLSTDVYDELNRRTDGAQGNRKKGILNQGHGSITNDKEGIARGTPDHELGG